MHILKRCSSCHEEKIVAEYYKNAAHPSGLDNICKICSKKSKQEQRKNRTQEKIEKDRCYKKEYVKNHIHQVRAQGRKDKRKAYRERVRIIEQIKKQIGGCSICGYNKCSWALDFHHLDPKEKEFSIRDPKGKTVSIERLRNEIKKCILVCSNCHKEIHYKEKYESRDIG